MQKTVFAIIILLILLLLIPTATFVFAQENQTQPTDPCANVVCNTPPADTCADGFKMRKYSSTGTCSNGQCSYTYTDTDCATQTKTCPDGYVASCKGACSNGVCSVCTPDCTGHDVVNKCANVACTPVKQKCPDGYEASCIPTCDPATGQCGTCSPNCAGHEAVDLCINVTCPPITTTCSDGSTASCKPGCDPPTGACGTCSPQCPTITHICGNGICESGESYSNCHDDCPAPTCPQIPSASCPPGKMAKPKYEGNCVAGYDCVEKECVKYTEPVCERGFTVSGGMDEYGCPRQRTCCGNGICEGNENQMNCKDDCIAGGPGGRECPASKTCPGGSTVSCRPDSYGGCYCDQCPIQMQNIPSGCRQERDEKGFVRVICEATCPPISDLQYAKDKCIRHNGTIVINRDARGCEYVDCRFGTATTQTQMMSPIPIQNVVCPSGDDLMMTEQKCRDMGMNALYVFEGGCKYVKCEIIQEKRKCGLVPGPEREQIERKCAEQGLGAIFTFDEQGCQHISCGSYQDCPKDPPKEAFEKCNADGGELVVKRDSQGCVNFVNCIRRGDTRDTYVEKPTEIPDSSELLGMAFKLENLKIDLDKLAKQADDIADYYKSVGSGEEGKYRRVADMFESMKSKVDEIKNKLRNRLETISIDDLMEVRQDIKYIKDVMIKDILYLMLSTGEDIKNLETTSESDCGTDSMCFDRAFRVCKPVTVLPEGKDGVVVNVIGLEGDACVLKATLPTAKGPPAGTIPGINPPYDMTCKIKNYALGVKNPQTDIMPYCEGTLMKLMVAERQKAEGTRQGVGICGDTICDSKEQQNPQSCPSDCSPLLTQQIQSISINLMLFIFDSEGYGPGGCYMEACVEYCTSRQQECLDYAEAMLQREGGPGNTRSIREVSDFCNKPENSRVCEDWARPKAAFIAKYMSSFTTQTQTVRTQETIEACSGCLNNGVCDPGECRDCADCIGR